VRHVNFTPKQLEAVDVENDRGDTCIVAVPGSGKTTVLVEFYRRLVIEKSVPPRHILAITFTEKAARNMKDKLAESFRELPERRRQLEQAHVSTIHGFCTRLLRENSVTAGLDPEFQVLDARRSKILQKQAASDALDRMFANKSDAVRRLIQGLASPDLAKEIPEIYDAMRAADIAPAALRGFRMDAAAPLAKVRNAVNRLGKENTFGWRPAQISRLHEVLEAARRIADLPDSPVTAEHFLLIDDFPTSLKGIKQGSESHKLLMAVKEDLLPEAYRALVTAYYSGERETLIEAIECFDRLYTDRKRRLGVLDFADLQTFAVQLLESDAAIRQRVRDEFQYVLMDEFQDTNRLEAKLARLIRTPGRFFAVGDINQSIYGFRHAEPGVFRAYRDEVKASGQRLVELEENWRSRPEILSAAETISHRAQGIEPLPLVAKREFPVKMEPSVEVLAAIAPAQDAALEIEARWVARRILDFIGSLQLAERLESRLAQFGDIAVLLRNSEVVPAFTRAFDEAGVPYLLNQGKGFFETREVVDLTTLLHAIDNPRDEIGLATVLRSPFAGVSDEALLRLKSAGNLGSALRKLEHLGAAFSAEDLDKLRRFREQMSRWREARDVAGFDRLLMRAMDETGYGFDPGTRAAANIEKFLALAREASSRLTLTEFVDELDRMREADAREPDVPPEDAVNAVRIMTVHAAKGLEFPVVFLAALHKGINAGCGSLEFSPNLGLGANWMNPVTGETKRDWFLKAIADEVETREAHESSRLLYVAMTRAEEHLVLSYSSFGKQKEWAAAIEDALHLDLRTPQQRVELIEAPNGEKFPLRVFSTNALPAPLARPAQASAAATIPTLPRPEVCDQHDFTASVTAVARFADCPRRYYLRSYLGWPGDRPRSLRHVEEDDDAPDEIDATEFGLDVHALLAGQPVAEATPDALRLVEAFHASPLGRRAARASRIERESEFLMAVEDVVLRGQIDLWFEEGGELVLVDYKTDQVKPREITSRVKSYEPQLRLYALALERIAGKPPDSAFVYFLRPGIAVPVSLERSLIDGLEALVRDFREAQSALVFPLREGEHCGTCPYFRGLCPAGSGVRDVVHAAAVDGEDLAGDEAGVG
jgi:ATP-dependent helicase/nuclease subunit A